MMDMAGTIMSQETLQDLRKIRNKYGGLPTEADLQGAAKALNRLQDIYKLNVTDFARGRIFGLQTAAELSVKDTFYLGRFAMMNNSPEVALRWLEEAVIQAASEGNQTSPVKAEKIEQFIKQVERKLPPGFRDLDAFDQSEESEEEEDQAEYRLLRIPEKTRDPKKFTTVDDEINYKALCQGRTLLPIKVQSKLQCKYDTLGVAYYLIGPVKVEVVYPAPHKVVVMHEIIHDREIEGLIKLAKPKINTATTGEERSVSDLRVSRNAWLHDSMPGIKKVNMRLNRLTQLQSVQALDNHGEGRKEEYEMLQIANYGIGGHYGYHQDPMFVYKEPDYMAKLGDQEEYITGDRLATFMMYLSDVPLGGRTAFPRLGISLKPEKGSAVFWFNIKRSGRTDMAMLHGGCPVLLGSKWVANKWIREAANIFHYPCQGHIDN